MRLWCIMGFDTVKFGTSVPIIRRKNIKVFWDDTLCTLITLVNTQNVSATKIVDSSSIQRAETKYGLRIQFLALVVTINEVWLNA